ncbi:MAG: hypothetical protein ACI38A_07455 [Candidatus Ornithomonoglobus sp.]
MSDITAIEAVEYSGKVSEELRLRAIKAYSTYKADRAALIARIKDNEQFYRNYYSRSVIELKKDMHAETPFIFSCIENAAADAAESYPVPNVLEREPEGTEAAEALSKIIPVQFDRSKFKTVYKENVMNKLKYGTAVYGVFYNADTEEIDIRSIDITDIYVDMHIDNVQDSSFMFISAVIDNDKLKEWYPKYKDLFCDDSDVDAITGSHRYDDKTQVLDCYYKKPDGTMHMMKLCKDTIIEATEDMEGYEDGLYNHGKYPVVFDVLYSEKDSPFGFGMLDIGKALQVEIDRLDKAITENIVTAAKPRYLAKRSGGINEKEFADFNTQIVHYEGDTDALQEIKTNQIDDQFINYRSIKIDELKEVLSNRDFQQGQTSGNVTAASAIQTLRETGEKRSRKMNDDSYDAYKEIVYMTIELMRQFYDSDRVFRIENDSGRKEFVSFGSGTMYSSEKPIQFDVEVVPQQENPYTREMNNNTILTLWNSGFFLPQNFDVAVMALQHMSFNGSNKLIGDISDLSQQMQQQAQAQQTAPAEAESDELIPIGNTDSGGMQGAAQTVNPSDMSDLIPLEITGGAS